MTDESLDIDAQNSPRKIDMAEIKWLSNGKRKNIGFNKQKKTKQLLNLIEHQNPY